MRRLKRLGEEHEISRGRCKKSQRRFKAISGEMRASLHLPSKSGHELMLFGVFSTFISRMKSNQ
jgi:hypothetical protein